MNSKKYVLGDQLNRNHLLTQDALMIKRTAGGDVSGEDEKRKRRLKRKMNQRKCHKSFQDWAVDATTAILSGFIYFYDFSIRLYMTTSFGRRKIRGYDLSKMTFRFLFLKLLFICIAVFMIK